MANDERTSDELIWCGINCASLLAPPIDELETFEVEFIKFSETNSLQSHSPQLIRGNSSPVHAQRMKMENRGGVGVGVSENARNVMRVARYTSRFGWRSDIINRVLLVCCERVPPPNEYAEFLTLIRHCFRSIDNTFTWHFFHIRGS